MGRLVVIEGCDGSGKATQAELLQSGLKKEGIECIPLDFPCYDDDSSIFVRMYLAGEFGKKVDDVGCYAASMFYATDRYVSFKRRWGKPYTEGATFISNRYTTSNAVHQMAKLKTEEWDEYLKWLFDFEYTKLNLPTPDLVIYLDIATEISEQLINERNKGDEEKKDIHERDIDYQRRSREAALYCCKKDGWKIVDCSEDGRMRDKVSISEEIFSIVKPYIS